MDKMQILPGSTDQNDTGQIDDLDARIDALAERYKNASGWGIKLLGLLGLPVSGLISSLPDDVQSGLASGTETALKHALGAAQSTRGVVGDQPDWVNTSITTALGAAGGVFGVSSALAELPFTVTAILRAIQSVAAQYDFDPALESVQFDCLQVLAANGPFTEDAGADLTLLEQRAALAAGGAKWITKVIVPRLAPVLGQKLAAQAVPVVGAALGAATNYAYTSYYQEIAHVHFGLRKLAIEAECSQTALVEQMLTRIATPIST